jgi:HD-GYP domain-containing protein (c-di-GMP phosphodiesterase class II)
MSLLLSLSEGLDLANLQHPRHHLRTAYIAWEIAIAARMPQHLSEQLFIAALLHDIGALTAENEGEFQKEEIIYPERHCLIGETHIKRVPMFAPSSQIVKNHHTFWREWNESIDTPKVIQAQILLLADTITALTESRPYRTAMKDQEVLVTLKEMGSKNYLDKNIVRLVDENFDMIQAAKMKQQGDVRTIYEQEFATSH